MTKAFARYAEDGRVTSAGHMDAKHIEAEQESGERIIALDEPVADLMRAYVIDGRIEYRDPPKIEASYAEKRADAYPPLTQFADALYWRERGDDKPWRAWCDACDAVKSRYPKEAGR